MSDLELILSKIKTAKVAYFSMEIGIDDNKKTYAGGLGILSGDHSKSMADLEVPAVCISCLPQKGYLTQRLNPEGYQIEEYSSWDPAAEGMILLPNQVKVNLEGRDVSLSAWTYPLKGQTGHVVPLLYLTTNVSTNSDEDKAILYRLYGGGHMDRLKSEALLGFGGVRMLRELNATSIDVFHLNEGHTAFVTLELLKERNYSDFEVKKSCVFTTHTPVSAGFDKFNYESAYRVLGKELPYECHIQRIAGHNELNMALLALNMSRYANGVAKKHGEVSRGMFPSYSIDHITNGVHSNTWTAQPFKKLFDQYIPAWSLDQEMLRGAFDIPNNKIWDAHSDCKQKLIDYLNKELSTEFNPNILTIGFARRATGYKRAGLLMSNLDELRRIGKDKIQIVYSGKAHKDDLEGKRLIEKVVQSGKNLADSIKVIYVPDYSMKIGALLTSGVDLWLNNPIRPLEASGTSGMKAAHNGVPNLSVLDGWWYEGCQEGITGWSIAPNNLQNDSYKDANDIYQKLEHIIIPMYYNNRQGWVQVMKGAIANNASYFNTNRMVKDYMEKAYKLKG